MIGNTLARTPWALYCGVLPLAIIEYKLARFPINRAFVGDWYCWTMYFMLFLFGFVLVCCKDAFWSAVSRIKWWSLMVGILAFSYLLAFGSGKHFNDGSTLIPFVKVLNMWSWILLIFALAASYLNKKSKVITYRNKAVYPFYILHQTIIIIVGYYLMYSPMHYAIKMLLMVVSTFGISWLIYEGVILRIPAIQPLFGVKQKSQSNAP